jgi:hypothetical protein
MLNTNSATNAPTAMPIRNRLVSALLPMRHTACDTIASTAGPSPAKIAVTAVVAPHCA